MKIIAICGPLASGKTTLAKQLGMQYKYQPYPFAAALKRMLFSLLDHQGATYEEIINMLYGKDKNLPTPYLCGQTPRHAMQTLGSEWRDMISLDLWTHVWLKKISILPTDVKVVVDDMRFIHEFNAVREFPDSIIVRLGRTGKTPSDHISEQGYLAIDPDIEIFNIEGKPEYMLETLRGMIGDRL